MSAVVTNGALHGLSLLLRLLTVPDDRVSIDHPTYPHAIDAIQRVACRSAPVALPSAGWDKEALAATYRQIGPRAYLIADFHNPTGRCRDQKTPVANAATAIQRRTALVSDETLSDIGLDMSPPMVDPPLEAGSSGWVRWERALA